MNDDVALRRHERRRLCVPIEVCWSEQNGTEDKSVSGNSIDVSSYGMGVELAAPIPATTRVKLIIDGVKVSTTATVRNSREFVGGSYWVGLEFQGTLLAEQLPNVHEVLLRSLAHANDPPREPQRISFNRHHTMFQRIANIRCLVVDHDFAWVRHSSGSLTLDCLRCRGSVPVLL